MEVIQQVLFINGVFLHDEGRILKYLIDKGLRITSFATLRPITSGDCRDPRGTTIHSMVIVVEGRREDLEPFAGFVSTTMPSRHALELYGLP